MSHFNSNTANSHQIIPREPTYSVNRKIVTIHTEDRDVTHWPNANEFEIQLPSSLTNVESIRLEEINLPVCIYNISKELQNDTLIVKVHFPSGTTVIKEITIDEGYYTPELLRSTLQYKFNLTFYVLAYPSPTSATAAKFRIIYNILNRKMIFVCDKPFSITSPLPDCHDNSLDLGLVYNLGFKKQNNKTIVSSIQTVLNYKRNEPIEVITDTTAAAVVTARVDAVILLRATEQEARLERDAAEAYYVAIKKEFTLNLASTSTGSGFSATFRILDNNAVATITSAGSGYKKKQPNQGTPAPNEDNHACKLVIPDILLGGFGADPLLITITELNGRGGVTNVTVLTTINRYRRPGTYNNVSPVTGATVTAALNTFNIKQNAYILAQDDLLKAQIIEEQFADTMRGAFYVLEPDCPLVLNGDSIVYMEVDKFNSIDELVPYPQNINNMPDKLKIDCVRNQDMNRDSQNNHYMSRKSSNCSTADNSILGLSTNHHLPPPRNNFNTIESNRVRNKVIISTACNTPLPHNPHPAPRMDYGGRINSVFAKISITNSADPDLIESTQKLLHNSSQHFNPPIEKIRKLKFKFRYHDQRLVNFRCADFSFSLSFNELQNQPLKNMIVKVPDTYFMT